MRGLHMQVHVGLVVPNFYRAEHDPLTTDVLIADGYKIDDGGLLGLGRTGLRVGYQREQV